MPAKPTDSDTVTPHTSLAEALVQALACPPAAANALVEAFDVHLDDRDHHARLLAQQD